MKKKPTILSAMTTHMVELYSISNRPYPSSGFGMPRSKRDFYTFLPRKKKYADRVNYLLGALNLQKFGIVDCVTTPKTRIVTAPYLAHPSAAQRAALDVIMMAYDRMDALEKLAQNGGFELSPAEAEYFAKKVKTR